VFIDAVVVNLIIKEEAYWRGFVRSKKKTAWRGPPGI
jgi:hypothetical protein